MRNIARLVVTVSIFLSGCAYVHTEKADLNSAPNGVRVFPSKLFIAVDQQKGQSTIFYGPDMAKAYDIKPMTIFAKNDFQVDVEDGQIKSMKSDQDSSGFLTFFQSITGITRSQGGRLACFIIEYSTHLRSDIRFVPSMTEQLCSRASWSIRPEFTFCF